MHTAIDPFKLARRQQTLAAKPPLEQFERLLLSLESEHGPVAWRAQFEQVVSPAGPQSTQLSLTASASVQVPCIRCHEAVGHELLVDRGFLLVHDEALAARLDEELDAIDVLAVDGPFNLLELIEDELILALPLMPRHETCPLEAAQALEQLADANSGDGEERRFPFAELAAQLGQPPKDKPEDDKLAKDKPERDEPE